MGVRVHYNVAPFEDGGGATIERADLDDSDQVDPQRAKVGEIRYKAICAFLNDSMNRPTVNYTSDTGAIDRAFRAGVDAVIAQLTTLADIAAFGAVVHQAWYQGMVYQGREVAPDRRHFDTLSAADRALDDHIARIVVQQAALTASGNIDDARAMGDDVADFVAMQGKYATPANAGMGAGYMPIYTEQSGDVPVSYVRTAPAEKLIRDIVATDDALNSINLTPKEWRLLVTDARRERNAAETRHAQTEELRRKDNAAWLAERDEADKIIVRLQGENATLAASVDGAISDRNIAEEAAKAVEVERDRLRSELAYANEICNKRMATIDNQAREIASWKNAVAAYVAAADESTKAIETQAREIAGLRETIAALRAAAEIPMTPEQVRFYGEAANLASLDNTMIETVAKMAHEVSTVRLMANSPRAKDSDTEGIRRRCAIIAGCAFSLAMVDGEKANP